MLTTDELTALLSKCPPATVDDFLPAYQELLAEENRDASAALVRSLLTGLCDHPERLAEAGDRALLNHLLLLAGMLNDTASLPLLNRLLAAPEFDAHIQQTAWVQGELSRVLGELYPAGSLPQMTSTVLAADSSETLTSATLMAMVFRWFSGYEKDADFAEAMRRLCEQMPGAKVNFELGMTIIVNAIAVAGEQLHAQIYAFYRANASKFQPQLPEKNLKNFFDLGRQRVKNMLKANYLGHYTTPQGELSRMLSYNPEEEEAQETPKALPPIVRDHPKVGRNDPCPCGSGKKYKNCCGR